MDPDRARELLVRLAPLVEQALDLALPEREAWLAALRRDQPALAAELEQLLADEGGLEGSSFLAASLDALAGPAPSLEGRQIGAYTVERPLGQGGMGSVWLARRSDGRYDAIAAIKLLNLALVDRVGSARFRREGSALARLSHPNVARLYDAGVTDAGQPYLVLEYVEGSRIDRYCEEQRLDPRLRLELFGQVLAAVAHVHAHRMVHRDLKPSNILVTPGGTVKLLDFGIAKLLEEGAAVAEPSTLTELAGNPLTPEYAAPEQLAGQPITAATDVYALGVLLYLLLTGRHPAPGGRTSGERLRSMREREPARLHAAVSAEAAEALGLPLAEVRRFYTGDLEHVVAKALRPRPVERYPTVEELAADLRRVLARQPVLARPASFTARARAAIRSHPLAAAVAVGVIGGVTALAVGSAGSENDSLVAEGRLERSGVVVADFTGAGPDSLLARALGTAFRIDLSQSPYVRVLSPAAVQSARRRMRDSAATAPLSDSVAREVAVREGLGAVVRGRLLRVGAGWSVAAELVPAGGGDLLAAARESAPDSTGLLAAVDRAAGAIRRRIGESPAAIRAGPKLEQLTTGSLLALQHYTAGLRAHDIEGDRPKARLLYEEAVALDSDFAMAWRALATVYSVLGPRSAMLDAATRAYRHRDRLTERERALVTGYYHNLVTQDYRAALAAFEELIRRYPNDFSALGSAGFVNFRLRNFDRAQAQYDRALGVDSTVAALHFGFIESALNRGDTAAAGRGIARLRASLPDNLFAEWEEVYLAVARRDYDAVAHHARLLRASAKGDTDHLSEAALYLATLAQLQGRSSEATRGRREAARMFEQQGDIGRGVLALRIYEATVALRLRRRPAVARAIIDSAVRRYPLDSLPAADRPYAALGEVYAELGDVPRAAAMQAAIERDGLNRGRFAEAVWHRLRGEILIAKHRYLEAQAELRLAADADECAICSLPALARSYDLAGERDSAIAVYDRYRATPWMKRLENDAVDLGPILLRLGELYDAQGDHSRAAAADRELAMLWKDGDPEFRRVAAAATARAGERDASAD
jgi:serine/threonine protein kinase/Tfp pilus assembly protein PilF